MQNILNLQPGCQLSHPLLPLRLRNVMDGQGQEDILPSRQVIQKLKILEQIADLCSPVSGKLPSPQLLQIYSFHSYPAAIRMYDRGDTV